MPLEHLEQLFLRPQATESSYTFLEQLIVDRVASKALGPVEGKDSLTDLLNVFTRMLNRAGSGWIVVKSRRISRRITLPILCSIATFDSIADGVIGALYKLLSVSPVLILCDKDTILVEITRILKVAQVPSVNLWRLVRSLFVAGGVGAVEAQLIISMALANLAISRTGYEAASCLEVLSLLMPSIATNTQILSTTVGLSQRSMSVFADDLEVRRLASDIIRKSMEWPDTSPSELSVAIPTPEVEESPQTVEIVEEPIAHHTMETPDEVPVTANVADQEDISPRSSCPSLDL